MLTTPSIGARLGIAVSVIGSEDPAYSSFRNPNRRRLLTVPSLALRTRLMGVLKSPGTPSRACVRRAFWRYHNLRAFSVVDTRAPGITSDWCIYGFFSCLRAKPLVMGSLVTVPSRDRFLSPVADGRGSYERDSRSTLVYRLERFFSLNVLSTWVPGHKCPR